MVAVEPESVPIEAPAPELFHRERALSKMPAHWELTLSYLTLNWRLFLPWE